MNLSVLHYDKTSKRHILQLKQGQFAGQELMVNMAVCANPLCSCSIIYFNCSLVSDGTTPPEDPRIYSFALDTRERKIAPRQKIDRGSRRLAKALVSEMEDSDWGDIYSRFVHMKQEQLRAADFDELDAIFPDDVLADPVRMVGYSEIVPYEPNYQFILKDRNWVADLQFCVNPECNCSDAHITFIPVPDALELHRRINAHLPCIFHDYKTSKYRIDSLLEVNQPTMDELIVELKRAYPDINASLKKQHNFMRRLYKKAKRQKLQQPADVAGTVKVGRNDPCPCGSGKKYKNCCGR
jgi:hypothetical protein